MSPRPSIKTVAAVAGVSPTSMSNAYNKPEQLSAPVRDRILAIAADLGYAGPNPSASSLRSRRTGSIGVLFAQELTYAFDDQYCTTMLRGVAEIASEAGSNLLLMPAGHQPDPTTRSRDEDMHLARGVRQAALDGAIADGLHSTHPVLRVLAEREVPVIRSVDVAGGRCVVIDDRAAAAAVGAHLRHLGHEFAVAVADSTDGGAPAINPDETPFLEYVRLRLAGLRSTIRLDAVVSSGRNTASAGRQVADVVLSMTPRPTAIAVTSDIVALGVLERIREHGLAPGRDIAVTGFDDVDLAEAAGLTTIRQPIHEKGRTMARMLLDPACTETRVELPTRLITRTSTVPTH